jgi:sec-independent protein translocase protein TatA
MPSLGPAEILVVLVIALLVFGPNKMPEIAKQVGKGFREFRRVQQHLKSELRDVVSEFDSPSSATVEQQAVPMLPPKETAPDDIVPTAQTPTPAPVADPPSPTAPAPPAAPLASGAPLPSPEPDDAPSESA